MKPHILKIAHILDQAAFNAMAIPQLSSGQKISLADAYDIQKNSISKRINRGEKLVGYKLGFTSKEKMKQMGVHSIICGRLTDKMEIKNTEALDLSQYIHPRIEPEIAFRVSATINKEISLEEINKYIDGTAAALEIIDSRYENFKFSLEDVIADNCSSAGFVLGVWQDITYDISNVTIRLEINGEEVKKGNSKAILGNPLSSIVEVSKMAEKYNFEIKKGSIILAGAATAAVYLKALDKIEGHFEDLGIISLDVI